MKQYFIMKETRNGTIYEALTNTKEEAFEKLWDMVRDYLPDLFTDDMLNRVSIATEDSYECHINVDIMAHTEDDAIGGIFDVVVDMCGERFTWYVDEVEYLAYRHDGVDALGLENEKIERRRAPNVSYKEYFRKQRGEKK